MKKRYVIINNFRFTIFIIFLSFFLSYLINYLIMGDVVYGDSKELYREIHIKEGDNLWNISKKFKSNEEDIREYILDINKINNIEGNRIYPGDKILIPKYI